MLRPSLLILALSPALLAQDKITFDDHVFPLFQQACLNCHNPDKAKGGLDLSTFGGTMKGGSGGKIVEPGDPGSKLIALVKQTAEPFMPPEGDKLNADQLAILTKWIEGGLLENKNSNARKPSKPKFEAAMRSDPAAKPDGPPPMPEHVLLEPPVLTPRASAIHSLATSPWAPLLAVTGQRQVLLHHTESLELVGILPFPEGDPISLAFTPEGRYLIVGGGIPGKSGVTVTFDVTTGERLLTAGKEFDSVLAADIRPGFDIVATGGPSRLLKLWNTTTGEQTQSIKKHTEWITALDVSPDGVLLASGDRNGGVWVWESETANEFHTLRAHQAAITATVFRADSNILATASEDGTVRYWEMNNGGEVRKNDAHPGGVTALALSRDGTAVTAGRDLKAKLWKPDFNHALDLVQNLPSLPIAVAIDGDAKRAFVADADGIIRVYNNADAKPLGEIAANPPSIAVRIEQIDAAINNHPTTLTTAEKAVADQTAALEAARKALADTETAHRQANEAHQAARNAENETKQKLETLRQAIAAKRAEVDQVTAERNNALAAIEPAKQALAAAPEGQKDPAPLAALEKAHGDLATRVGQLEAELAAVAKDEPTLAAALNAATQAATAAEQPIKPTLDAIEPARKTVAEREATLAQATQAFEAAKGQIPHLHAYRKRWAAAAINTKALAARTEAERVRLEAEDQLDAFSTAIAELTPEQEKLNTKRAEAKAILAKLDSSDLTEDARKELESTLKAVRRTITRTAENLRQLEQNLLATREAADTKVPQAHQTTTTATQLKNQYLEALK
jgi:WD40 repeat protein